MKNTFLFALAAFLCATFLPSCSNDFEVTDDWKDISVVYGLLNHADTNQYIRVQKAFLDPTTSALVIAQVSDSIYYQNVSVQLQQIEPIELSPQTLTLVDGNLEGIVKDEGVFSSSPNWLYKSSTPLNENATYKVIITNDLDSVITAETEVVENFGLFYPPEPQPNVPEVYLPFYQYAISTRSIDIKWENQDKAAFYDLYFDLHYWEGPMDESTDPIEKSILWKISDFVEPLSSSANEVEVSFSGDRFYRAIANSVEKDATKYRRFKDYDIRIDAGGEDLFTYINVGTANAGITSTQDAPVYTNLSSGRGVFSSRYTKLVKGLHLSDSSLDSLIYGDFTGHLNFRE